MTLRKEIQARERTGTNTTYYREPTHETISYFWSPLSGNARRPERPRVMRHRYWGLWTGSIQFTATTAARNATLQPQNYWDGDERHLRFSRWWLSWLDPPGTWHRTYLSVGTTVCEECWYKPTNLDGATSHKKATFGMDVRLRVFERRMP
jgi:hypothetical protein